MIPYEPGACLGISFFPRRHALGISDSLLFLSVNAYRAAPVDVGGRSV
jgi:hypothetical protein